MEEATRLGAVGKPASGAGSLQQAQQGTTQASTAHRLQTSPTPPHSEAALASIKPRSGLPAELAAEVDQMREGLLKLRQNVLLLRDEEDKDRCYPVRGGWGGVLSAEYRGEGVQ